MGQFRDQPDFATSDVAVCTPSDDITRENFLDGAIIFIGDNSVGTDLRVIPSGAVGSQPGTAVTDADAITFSGLGTGGFLPVTVDYVLATGTTVESLISAR